MPNIINVTVNDTTEQINVTVSDGILTTAGSSLTVIDGFIVDKGAGNVAGTIEVNDKIRGWIDDVYVAGRVNTIPVNDVSDVTTGVQGEIF